jgi:uncharacterized protein YunC (DUF1805 family)
MINVAKVKVGDKTCLGVKVELPDSPPLLLIVAEKGFVMCGFLNIEAAERLRSGCCHGKRGKNLRRCSKR